MKKNTYQYFTIILAFLLPAFHLVAQTDPKPDPEGTILIENDNPSVANNFNGKPEKLGSHEVSGGTVLKLGANQRAGDGSRSITVTPTFPKAGLYKVVLRWATPKAGMYGHNVPITLTHKGGKEEFKINQRGGNAWVNLGTYAFDEGPQLVLEMNDKGIFGNANLDAMKFIPVAALPTARPAPPAVAAIDDFEKLRSSIRNYVVSLKYGRGEAETDPDVIAKQRDNERLALIYWGSMDPAPDRISTWQAQSNQNSDKRTAEATWLKDLAAAYAGATNHLGGDLRGNPDLLKAILDGLKTLEQRFNATTKWDVNWWDYEIGIPTQVLETLCILGDAVPKEMAAGYLEAVKHFTETPKKFYNKGAPSSGSNMLWLCKVHLYRGALEKNDEILNVVRDLSTEPLDFVVRDPKAKDPKQIMSDKADGFYEDGSFIQHGGVPYGAAYGFLLINSFAEVGTMLKGSPWEIPDEDSKNVFGLMECSMDPFVVRGETVAHLFGRSHGNPSYEGNRNVANFLVTQTKLLPMANPDQAARLRGLVKKWLKDEPSGSLKQLALVSVVTANPVSIPEIKAIDSDPKLKPVPTRMGFQGFPNMDMANHRTGETLATLRMCSHRTYTFESIWSENIKGWYQSDGVLLLYTPDIERYRGGYFNLVDPYRLPGITVERFEREAADGGKAGLSRPGGSDFVGSVGLNGNGLSAMFLKPADGVLEARKSWFFLGNQIVCLGAGIGANSENVIETVVENARLADEAQKLSVNGKPVEEGTANWPDAKWAFLTPKNPGAELGWVFLQGNPALNTLIETRSGARTDTHLKTGDPTPISLRFATLWLDHGKGLSNSTYAYVILPGQDAGKVEAYAAKPGVEILSNTAAIQAVRDKVAGVTGLVAYQPAEVAGLSLSQPALAMVEEKPGTITLALSDPTMRLKAPVRLKTALTAKAAIKTDERIQVISLSPLEIEFKPDGLNGQSHTAEFSR